MEDAPFLCLTSAEVGERINDSLVVARVLEYCLQRRVTDLGGLSRAFQDLVRQVSFGWKMNVMVCLACRKMVLQVEEYNLLYVAGYSEREQWKANPDPLKKASFIHKCRAREFLFFSQIGRTKLAAVWYHRPSKLPRLSISSSATEEPAYPLRQAQEPG